MQAYVLYVGLWAHPPYDRISQRFAHMYTDCRSLGYDLRLWHYDHGPLFDDCRPAGIILSGSRFDLACAEHPQRPHRPLQAYDALIQQLHRWSVPVLGICYGHQLLALAEGCQLGLLGEKRRAHDHPIQVVADDMVLGPSQSRLWVPENHQMVVQTVDLERWRIVAQSCDGVEALRHHSLPWLGLQFHPEYHPESRFDHAQDVFIRWLEGLSAKGGSGSL